MADQWMIRGLQFANCNCAAGCPCQFNAPTTHGHCEAVEAGRIEEGHFNDTRLDGLAFVMLLQWPGEIADGNGREQIIIDERADSAQREALRKIVHGESTAPGATHFYVFNSTMSEVLETLYAPIDLEIDVASRRAPERSRIGRDSCHPNSGSEQRRRIPCRLQPAQRLSVDVRRSRHRQLAGRRGNRAASQRKSCALRRAPDEPGRSDPLARRIG